MTIDKAQAFNAVLNHPTVHPYVAADEKQVVDVRPALKLGHCELIADELGGFFYDEKGPTVYQVHTALLPEARGVKGVHRARKSLEHMFLRTDALEIQTIVAEDNQNARRLTEACGFRLWFERENAIVLHGQVKKAGFWRLSIWDWLTRFSPDRGKEFHETLESQKERLGIMADNHSEDKMHDRVVGATIEMARNGHLLKGVQVYNRWASLAGYKLVKPICDTPPVIDIHDCYVQINQDNLEVLPCQ